MRCISPHPRYSIQVIEGQEQVVVDQRGYAQTVVLGKPVIANFEQSGLMDWEIEAALECFSFAGVPDGVNPLTRISVWDSEAYSIARGLTEEQLAAIDKRLTTLAALYPSEFRIIEAPAKAKPWPSYDEDDVDFILTAQERLQLNPEIVRLYEHENQGREEIIRVMSERQGLVAENVKEDEVVVSA